MHDSRHAIGLMSGTAMDGTDAVLVEISREWDIRVLHSLALPYPAEVSDVLHQLLNTDAALDSAVLAGVLHAELQAQAVKQLLEEAEMPHSRVSVIGYHGQTIRHMPQKQTLAGFPVRGTLQIGDAATLAQRTGIAVVSDLRSRDMAAGGEGAPLVPAFDYYVIRSDGKNRAALNIGGIANITCLPAGAGAEEIIAFDTGPGNCLIDMAAHDLTSGNQRYDRDGLLAAAGQAERPVLDRLLALPWFGAEPPKSTGRELFNREMLNSIRDAHKDPDNLPATLTALTAESIAAAVLRFWPGKEPVEELFVSGGGVHNRTLMNMLQSALPEVTVNSTALLGIDPDMKEAVAFAWLANRTMRGLPGNLPSATGARQAVVLGSITPAGDQDTV